MGVFEASRRGCVFLVAEKEGELATLAQERQLMGALERIISFNLDKMPQRE
jgi:hypothetical protein